MLYLWYIDGSSNRSKIHTYATFKDYFHIVYSTNDMLYHTYNVHIVQLAIEKMLSLSEMYHGTFTNRNKSNFLCRRLIKMSDKLNMHAYYLLSLYILS